MKKTIAFLISLSFIFLCSCSGNNNSEETTAVSEGQTTAQQITQESQTTEKAVEYVSDWGSELIPANFPAPPDGTHDVSVGSGKADDSIYQTDWVRIKFTCTEASFYIFSNQMNENGYTGGTKNIKNGTYYTNGFKGYWQDGKNLVRIYKSEISNIAEITFTIDIIECRDNFPEELTEFFPKFNGFTKAQGVYCGHDADGKHETYDFGGSFTSPRWHWDFRFTDGFIGVEQSEFEAYYKQLDKMEFSGVISTATVDGCSTFSVDVEKEIDGIKYCVFMLYNQSLKTLDIAYTNDPSIYEHD